MLGAGASIYGASQSGDAPGTGPVRMVRQMNKAKEKYGGQSHYLNMLESLRDPQIQMSYLQSYLMGSPGETRDINYDQYVKGNKVWLEAHEKAPAGARVLQRDASGRVQYKLEGGKRYVNRTHRYDLPETRGLLPFLREDVTPALDEMQSESIRRQAGYNIDTLRDLGPGMYDAYQMTLDPGRRQGLEALQTQLNAQVAAGPRLDPGLMRHYQQATRQNRAAMGMGYGNFDAFREITEVGEAGERRRKLGQDQMMQLLALRGSLDPNVAGMVMGTGGGVPGAQAFTANALSQTRPGQWDPFNPGAAAYDSYNTGVNAQAASNISSANNWAGIGGAFLGGAGDLYGAYLQGKKPGTTINYNYGGPNPDPGGETYI